MSSASVVQEVAPSRAIIEEVAAQEGVDPVDLDVPLFETIDPEALDTLVETADTGYSDTTLLLEFTYYGYDVGVSSDGAVSVSRTA